MHVMPLTKPVTVAREVEAISPDVGSSLFQTVATGTMRAMAIAPQVSAGHLLTDDWRHKNDACETRGVIRKFLPELRQSGRDLGFGRQPNRGEGGPMPHLYCEKHGKKDEAETARDSDFYRGEGESVVIVAGKLMSGPWACDRCNATLLSGNTAYLASSFPAWVSDSTTEYDFAYEREYFAASKSRVAVYGAPWPAVAAFASIPPAGRPGAPAAKHRPTRPICALDLLQPKRNG
jgi:hypothetical protein